MNEKMTVKEAQRNFGYGRIKGVLVETNENGWTLRLWGNPEEGWDIVTTRGEVKKYLSMESLMADIERITEQRPKMQFFAEFKAHVRHCKSSPKMKAKCDQEELEELLDQARPKSKKEKQL